MQQLNLLLSAFSPKNKTKLKYKRYLIKVFNFIYLKNKKNKKKINYYFIFINFNIYFDD